MWEDISWRRIIVNGSVDNFNKIFIKNSRPHACRGFVPFPADLLTRDEGSTQVNSPVYNTADAWLPTRACPIYVLEGNVLMLMQAWGCHRTGHHSPSRGESHFSVQNSPICELLFCVLPSAGSVPLMRHAIVLAIWHRRPDKSRWHATAQEFVHGPDVVR